MGKTTIALIVAATLIVSGGILIFFGMRSVNFDLARKPVYKTYGINDPFQDIRIDTRICNVTFVKADAEAHVVCPETEKLSYTVMVEDGVLQIRAVKIHNWYDFIGINLDKMEMTVYLPEEQYNTLHIKTNTGGITIPKDFSFTSAEVVTDTGDIDFSAAVTEQLTATVTTGDIQITDSSPALMEIAGTTGDVTVYGSSPSVMRITTTTGDIVLDEIAGSCEFSLGTTSGDVQAQNVACEVMACGTTTGSITFYRVIAQGYLGVCSTTGDILLEDCDSADVNIETTTGDVSGNFLSPKWFIPDTNTGDIVVPFSREGGECRVTTTTGDIRFH